MLEELLAKLMALEPEQRGLTIMRLSTVLGTEWEAIKAGARATGSISTRDPRFVAYDYVTEAVFDTSDWYRPHRHGGDTRTALDLAETRAHVDRLAEELLKGLAKLPTE